jgi:NAD(P)H dehydrogenase (quinone)
MNTKYNNAPILVTGASGKLGQAVLSSLEQFGATNVIAGTRTPASFHGKVPARELDFNRPETFAAALAGVERMLLISTGTLDDKGSRIAQHRAIIQAAADAGVKHVVYTSAPAARPGKPGLATDDHFWTEVALFQQPRLHWTILRNEIYSDMLPIFAGSARQTGKMFSATNGKGRAYVTRQDCADAAAAALLSAEGNAIYDITGPAAPTQDRIAALLTEATGTPIQHVAVSAEALREGMTHAGLPSSIVEVLVGFDIDAAQGYHEILTNAVEQLTGRKPTSVEEFLSTVTLRED